MAHWLMLNLANGKWKDKQLVKKKTMAKIHAPQMVTGGIDGFLSDVSFLPRDNTGVVLLTNSESWKIKTVK